MSITVPKKARSGLALMLAATFGLVLLVGAPSGAAPQDANFALESGTLAVGDTSFTLPSEGGLTGTIDDETGEFTGTFVIAPISTTIEPAPGVVADVVLTLTQPSEGTGTVDLETGAVTFDVSLDLGIEASVGGSVVTPPECQVSPVELTFEGMLTEDGTLTLSDSGFILPASTGCGDAIGPLIDGALAGDTTADLTLLATDEPIEPIDPTTPTDPTDPTTPPSTPVDAPTPGGPARPISTEARFTG